MAENNDYSMVVEALGNIHQRIEELKNAHVLRSNQDARVDLSEWYVAEALGGCRAKPTQKGWDVEVGKKKIQVKFNGKKTTNNFWGTFKLEPKVLEGVDQFVFVQLADDYRIHGLYGVPTCELANKERFRRDKNGNIPLSIGKNLKPYLLKAKDCKNPDILRMFGTKGK